MTNLTRRGLLAGTVAATAAGLLLPYGVAAQEAQPKVGGSMRIGMSGAATSDTLDPALFLSGPVIIGMLAVCNTLVEIDHTGKAVPDLAESVEPDAGAVIWTFKIRSDATFGDGKAVTAKDVIASFNHHRGEASKSGAKGPLEQVKDIRADGDHTVVFELNSGNADFATITADYHYLIMPANEDGTMNWQSGLGTGGYTLEHHDPGVRVSLKRRGDYFKRTAHGSRRSRSSRSRTRPRARTR
ncbi:ABC transporter substrate-binding protein [Paracoccus cavernae]|uniref:ABC transporter substrate-binding protein n=1 Tax=Paracoccus cavernae TaxID=1571207 RepID=A0ABT8DAF6_9RHOB|nr:ABC transporter substrate-binding protein [Paracoccus cavernae]